MNTRWFPIDPSKLRTERGGSTPAVHVSFYVSPYNIPSAVRSGCGAGHRKVIEFRYIDGDEPTVVTEHQRGWQLEVGRNSDRIFRIIVDDEAVKSTTEVLAEVFARLKAALSSKGRRAQDNFEVTEEIVSNIDKIACEFETRA